MLILYFAVFGAIIGSFLNVLVLRHGSGISMNGRSFCDTCGESLRWYHLFPIISWLVQRGRCSCCGARISVQYPIVETLTALVFVGVGVSNLSLIPLFLALVAVALLIAISTYDILHTIIPDQWVYSFAAVSFLFGFAVFVPQDLLSFGFLLLSGPAAAFPLFALWIVSGGRWMGLGDVKLALGIGWLLGPYWGLVAIFGGFLIGAVVSVLILLPLSYIIKFVSLHIFKLGVARESFTMKSEVPFGPFLACSCYLIWLSQYTIGIPIPFLW